MSISEEELQEWEEKLIRDNPGRLLHLIKTTQELQKNLNSSIAKEVKEVMLHAVTQFELQEVRQQLKAAQNREKVAMRALEMASNGRYGVAYSAEWWMGQAEKELEK